MCVVMGYGFLFGNGTVECRERESESEKSELYMTNTCGCGDGKIQLRDAGSILERGEPGMHGADEAAVRSPGIVDKVHSEPT